ncbi:hypothetical protein BDC45DRAFT_495533 [Circinella umbellata]|nr:hypothetical protein BDC45DRAFT_495533 [Circinella umbellata]
MDPYRPRPYGGYRPRPQYGGYGRGGGFRPNYIPGRPPMHHPMSLNSTGRPPPMGNRHLATSNAANAEAEGKLTTLFVGGIAPGINDACIEKLLKAAGNVKSWKRMKDTQGSPKGFGFVEYEDPDSVLRALRVLGGENDTHQGLTLTAMDGSGTEKKLIVKADDNVRNYLQQHQSIHSQQEIEAKDKESLTKIYSYVDSINRGQEPTDEATGEDTLMPDVKDNKNNDDEQQQQQSKQDDANDNNEQTDDNDFINKELAFFKERAAQRDQEKQRIREERRDERRDERDRTRSPSRRRRRTSEDNNRRSNDDFVRGPSEHMSQTQEEMEMDDEELERRREEKHEKDVEIAFRQRERRLEGREISRLRNYERDLQRLKDAEKQQEKDKEYWAARLAEWDDDVEIERGEEAFYSNRSRWRRHREAIRRREDERDEEDRRLEEQEIEDERKRIEQKERLIRQKEEEEERIREAEAKKKEEAPRIAIKPTKISFNAPIKRHTVMGGGDEDDEDESARKRRVLVPLDYGDDEMMLDHNETSETSATTSSEMDPEERVKKVKELIDSIPSSEQELWNWNVKWDQVDEELLDEKLKPFISKKIVEIVGAEDDEFVGFILDFVRRQQTPNSLVQELEMTLDAEALVFVMKLWRALIFETERKAAKL